MNTAGGALSFDAQIRDSEFNKTIQRMENQIRGLTQTTKREAQQMDGMVTKLIGGIGAAFTVDAAFRLRSELINVRGEFQKYEAVLTNSLGSHKEAAESMDMLSGFAAKTPFQLDKLTESYVKLVNQGFKPTKAELTQMGDLTSSVGKTFDQLTEGLLDAQQGEWERMKEFGIKGKIAGDQVVVSFKGVTTTIENSAKSVREYILGLGKMEGVSGSMEAISKTLVGQVSNLEDAITNMFNNMGKSSEAMLSGSISAAKYLVDNYAEIGDILKVLIATYGAYKTAVIVTVAVQNAAAMATKGWTAAEIIHFNWLRMVTAAQALLNRTMLANPYVLVATAIGAVAAGLYVYMSRLTETEKIEKRHLEIKTKYTEQLEEEASRTLTLAENAANENLQKKTRLESLEKLKASADGYLDRLTLENIKTEAGQKLLKGYNDQLERRVYLEANQEEMTALIKEKRDIEKQKKALDKQKDDLKKASSTTPILGGSSFAPTTSDDVYKNATDQATNARTKLMERQNAVNIQLAELKNEQIGLQDIAIDNVDELGKKYETVGDKISKLDGDIKELAAKKLSLPSTDLKGINDINSQIAELEKRKKALTEIGDKNIVAVERPDVTAMYDEMDSTTEAMQDKIDKSWQAYFDGENAMWLQSLQDQMDIAEKKAEIAREVLAETVTLNEQEYNINTKYAEKRKVLLEENPFNLQEKLSILDKNQKDELDTVKQAKYETTEVYKQLSEELINNKRTEIQKRIDLIRKAIATEKNMTDEQRKKYKVELAELSKMLTEKNVESLQQAADLLYGMGDSLKDVNDELSEAVKQLAELANIAAQVATGNYVGAIVGLANMLIKEFNTKKEEAEFQAKLMEDAAKAFSNFVQSEITELQQLQRQIDETYGMDKLELYEKKLQAIIWNLNKSIAELNKRFAEQIAQGKPSLPYIDDKSSLEDIIKMLDYIQRTTIDESRQNLLTNTSLSDAERERLTAELDLYEQNLVALKELKTQKEEYLTGTTADNIADGIMQGLEDGFTNVEAFGDKFEATMRQGLLNAIKNSILNPLVEQWMADFALAMEDNTLTEQERKDLQDSYNAIVTTTNNAVNTAAELAGITLTNQGSANALTGAIKGITEEQAGVLTGQVNGIRMAQAASLDALRLDVLANQETAKNTRLLKDILDNLKSGSNPIGGSGISVGG